jgi:hypothetical protein
MENRETSKASPIVSWQALVLIAAIASNLFWATPVLKSSRPQSKSAEQRTLGKQDVDARLWQDPFQAIGPHALKSTNVVSNQGAHTVADLARQIEERLPGTVDLLPVLVTGSPYAEDSEWRLRSRYALISALTVSNYTPEDSQHIGFIGASWPNDATTSCPTNCPASSEEPSLVVPYEWFKWTDLHSPYPPSDRQASDYVLVLWLRDEVFSDHPLLRLSKLIGAITSPVTNKSAGAVLQMKVLGPYGSTTLHSMYADALMEGSWKSAVSDLLKAVRTTVYSSSATAADQFVISERALLAREPGMRRRTEMTRALAEAGVKFVNCTCTDQDLSRELLRELRRRRVDVNNRAEGIVMISEEDTFYGRSLPAAFDIELQALRIPPEEQSRQWAVRHYTYLRGLDGKSASGEQVGEKGSATDKKPEGPAARLEGLDRPENAAQLDYVRRMVERIRLDCSGHEEHARHFKGENPPDLKAIGIVGSDVYDKLLLLQSLRKQFSDVLFFTTDLDARLFHPQELKASRNVLVASSFGLELSPGLQHDIPPFRDSYQTALFFGTCVALGSIDKTNLAYISPRLFEIGQLGAVDLSATELPLHPPRENYGEWSDWQQLKVCAYPIPLLAMLLLISILPGTRQRLVDSVKKQRTLFFWTIALAVLAVVLFLEAMLFDYCNPEGEPLLLTAGVSIWPTEILRLITGLLCYFWLLVTLRKLQQDKEKIGDEFGISAKQQPACAWLDMFLHPYRSRCKAISISSWKAKEEGGTEVQPGARDQNVSASVLWRDYSFLGAPRNRLIRVMIASLLYFGLGVCLIMLDRPFVPGRGNLSFMVDKVVMILVVLGLIILMFLVVDATRLCSRLVENLTAAPTKWTPGTYKLFQPLRQLPQAYLGDWIDIKFVAARTKTVVKLIYYPFIIIFLMIISRSHFFDAWDWPWGLRIVVTLNAAYAFFCAACLRVSAEKARAASLERLREKLAAVRAGKMENDEKGTGAVALQKSDLENGIKELINEIKGIEEGAFAPWSRQPLVGALIMPFTGAGLVAWLQYLATSH